MRLHLLELEDQPWFPAVFRDLATDYLQFMQTRFELHKPATKLLGQALRAAGRDQVVDLCSGGGGPISALSAAFAAEGLKVTFTLTDRFPNVPAFSELAAGNPSISFSREPVDARSVPRELVGFRTMFNAFHHFRPEDAAAVLRDAASAGQPIGIFEIPERRLGMILPMLLLTPLIVLLTTPFIHPFRWRRLFWTYVLPLVPLTCWWDGIVSQLRAYTPAELQALAAGVGVAGYEWKAGQAPIGNSPGSLTYLIGHPNIEGGEPG